MNKILTKVTALCVGLAMVAGVGVAVGSKKASAAHAETATWTASSQGFSDTQQLGGNSYAFTDSNVTISFGEASGNGHKYYNNGTAVRSYGGNSFTISCSAGNLTSITLSNNQSKEVDANVGTYSANSWTGNSASVTFTVQSGGGNFRTSTVTAVYTPGGGGGEDPVLQSIAVSDEVTAYNVGDEFVKPTVTATYDQGEPQDVTSSATCTGYNMGVAGEYTVTVSYGGKTAEYDITVSDPTPVGDLLYSCDFTGVENHSYTQNKEFTLNEKGWVASVSQVNGGVFYLGCNSTHAAKGILNDNTSFADVVTALAAEDSAYSGSVATAHAYAMRFANAYDNVGSVEFVWAGGNNAFQVYLFGDQGDGLVKLASTNYATSSATTSGNVKWNASGYGESFNEFVVVARPGATGSTATSKTLRAATFKIYEGEAEPVDPTKDTLNILLNDATPSPATVRYSNGGLYYANDKDGNDVNAEWSSSNTSIFTVGKNGNNVCYVTPVAPGTANIIAKADGYNDGIFVLTIDAGAVETITVSGEMTKTSYSTAESWSPAGLTVTANYEYGYHEDVTTQALWSYNPAVPAENVTSVVATAEYSSKSGSSAAQTVSVTVSHAGTAEDPFTVAEGIAKCVEIGNKSGGEGPWVTTGKISSIVQVLTTGYQNARFYITEDGKTTSASIYAYDCKYLGNAGFTEETAANIVVGATVTITGNLLNYNNNTPEYARGCYLLDIKAPETGDVDVTFEPTTSYEIGATGTFSATSETAGVTFTWSVDEADVLSVDAATGAFEAKALGVARVTVTATAGDKAGFAFADITINAKDTISVSEANEIGAALPSGTTTSYYIYVEGFVKEFGTSMKDTSPRAFDIMDLSGNKIMIYTNVDPYAAFIEGLKLGDYIKVKGNVQNYNGTYEITSPEKVSSRYSYVSFAFELISSTDEVCSSYGTDNYNYDNSKTQFANVWTTLSGASSFGALEPSDVQELVNAHGVETSSNPVEVAMYRYDLITAKYALDNFINERVIPTYSYVPEFENNVNSSNSIGIIVIVAVSSMTLLGLTLVIRKRKHQ